MDTCKWNYDDIDSNLLCTEKKAGNSVILILRYMIGKIRIRHMKQEKYIEFLRKHGIRLGGVVPLIRTWILEVNHT